MNIKKQDIIAHKFLVSGLVLLFLLNFVAKKFVINPMYAKLSAAKSRVSTLTSEKQNLEKEVAILKDKESLLEEKETRLTEYFMLKSKLVDFSKSSIFLRNLFNYNGVKIESIKPDKKERVGQFKKWQLKITVSGSFSNINGYFNYLDTLPYLLNVKKVELSKVSANGVVHANIVLEAVGR